MNILVALDAGKYSKKILKDVARLAENTLADIILLGVQGKTGEPDQGLSTALVKCQHDIYSYFSPEEIPYADFSSAHWKKNGKGDWSMTSKGLKQFTLKIQSGSIARQVVQVARETECDLIILGCSNEFGCEWDGEMNVPLRIAEDAPCSVLVIKKNKNTKQIVSILDQSIVSQEALEMVNQLVTLHDAGLKIVGVKETKESKKGEMEQRIVELLKYYNDRQVSAWVKLVDVEKVKEYVTSASKEATVALWMGGRQSLIKRLFSQSMVDKLLESSRSSVFILR